MNKLLSIITMIAIVGILASIGFFGYNKYQEVEFAKNKLQAKQKENIGSNSRSISEPSNKENQQKVTRDNVFDYAIAAINKVGNADLLKFQEPEYNG